jgi:hypothetical protein
MMNATALLLFLGLAGFVLIAAVIAILLVVHLRKNKKK